MENQKMDTRSHQTFEKKPAQMPEPLIITNDKKIFIRPQSHRKPARLSRQLFLKLCPSDVIDRESLDLIQVLELHRAIDHTKSATGSAVLLRSLIRPGTDLKTIRSKQAALTEIASNDRLRGALEDFVLEYGNGESALYTFFNKGIRASFPYPDIKKAKKAAVNITRILQALPRAESAYLKDLTAHLHSYGNSFVHQMMNGSIYKTFTGLKSEKEVGLFTLKLKFIPRRFTEWTIAGPAVFFAPLLHDRLGLGSALSPMMSTLGIGWTCAYAFYSLFIKPVRDTENFIEPFRKACVHDPTFSRTIDTMGMVDELLSCHTFAKKSPHTAMLPEVTDEPRHFFEAVGLKSPVLARENADFVPNNICLNGARLTFISGPNSGGKTTLCKSIVHNQLLAQAGGYVLAEKAAINIADRIRYQAPKFDGLQDDEGRFGTELGRTRDIFYSTGPKSLAILDELAEGTTVEETLRESYEILKDFHTIGNNTVLVTHNHSLIDRFMAKKKGQCLRVEFSKDAPTYRIIPGISRVSHADRIAEKINFSKKDRHRYMKEKGYV